MGFQWVFKANPYHDHRGRFATANSHTFVSTGPAFDKTVAKLKAKLGALEKTAATETFLHVGTYNYVQAEKIIDHLVALHDDHWKTLTQAQISAMRNYTSEHAAGMNMGRYKVDSGHLQKAIVSSSMKTGGLRKFTSSPAST